MQQFFVLSKENLELSKAEVLALTKAKKYQSVDNLLILNNEKKLDRLAMTSGVYKFLFTITQNKLIEKLKSFNWQKEYKTNFKLTLHHSLNYHERDLAGFIYDKIKNPKVDLKNPVTSFEFFFLGKKIVVGKLLYNIWHEFDKRNPKLWPAHHPTGMKPKLSRCLINLTGIQKGTFYDVMCGAGGFLIEGGLLMEGSLTGFKVIGYDINKGLLKKAEINLKHFGVKNFFLEQKDATKIKHKIKYLATDLPYGRATGKINRPELYLAFLKNLKKILTGTAVIVFPNYSPYRELIKKAKLKISQEFSIYMHHSLTRKIVVIKKE
ncbi:hypothetical protein HZA97_02715 [Candidatus Woesearchaeota archaeon]|nr:hypothetical protein [Candidatus Woesearchaeota archaeon]